MNKLMVLFLAAALPAIAQDDIMPRPPKPAPVGGVLARLIHDTRVGEAQQNKNLTILPLFSADHAPRGYWTLDQALAKDVLRISEKGEGSVPELLAENLSDEPVFLLAGEIVTGGKQNRVVSQDILLAPHSGAIGLGVFCVEQGRWTQQTRYFGVEKYMAHAALRLDLNAPSVSQSAVWGEVARKNGAVAGAMPNPTGYLGTMYESSQVKRNLDDYTKAIVWTQDANGMAVMIGERVVGVEIFGDSETFGKLRDKLLRSYAVDALEEAAVVKPVTARVSVERFLQTAHQASLRPKETIGLGRLFGIEGGRVYGSVLTWDRQHAAHGVVHASLFEDLRGESQPPVSPRPFPRYRD